MKQEVKRVRLQLIMNTNTNKQLRILQAYLGGTDGKTGKFKEVPKVTVIEEALAALFKANEQKMIEQLTSH